MRKMIKNYWKKALSMMLIAALLIQILPATAKGAEIDASADAVTYAAPSCELQTGLSDMYEYQTYDVGKAGTLYLNTYSGYPHVKRTDFTYGGERMPVEISFYFDPANDFTTNNPYGAGWSSCYNQLVEYDTESTQYKYKNGNGTWIYFSNSGEVTEDGDEIWTEDTTYGIGETGATLYRKPTAALSNYVAVNVIHMDKTYSFDSLGRLTSINDGVNEITISYITSTSAIKKIVDPLGRMFCFEYGSYLTAIQVYDHLDGPYTKINYTISGGKLINVVYGSAGYVNYNYDTICQLIRLRDMDGCGYELNYGKLDVASCITQKAGMGTSDAESGVTVSIEHPTTTSTIITSDSTRQTYKFDGCGRITNSELENLLTDGTYQTVYGYNMTYDYISDEDGAVVNSLVDVEYYDANGIIEEDAKGSTEEETAEETTVEVTEQDATEEETEESEEVYEDYITTADDYGNILTETHIVGDLQQVITYGYSMNGNYLASVTDADGRVEKYTYENWDGLITTITDGNGNQTNYTYNALRELASVQMNVSGLKTLDASTSSLVDASETMDVVYDYEKGRLTSISYGDCIYLFTYDKWGNILSVTMDDTMLVTYEYGENACKGLVSTITYGNGQSVYYTYNNLGQVVTVGYVENEVRFTYTYASDGTLENVYDTSQCVVTKYTEDGYQIYMGTPESVSELLYEYAGAEDNYVETVLGQVLNIEVENDERVTLQKVLSDAGVPIFSEQTVYDAFERLEEKVLSTGRINLTQSYEYVTSGNTTGNRVSDYNVSYNRGNGTDTILFSYTYDGNGNITSVETKGSQLASHTTEYTYDEAGQLVEAYDEAVGRRYIYSYDVYGNLIARETRAVTASGTETVIEQEVMSYSGMLLTGTSSSVDGTTSYTLDAMGNPVSIKKSGQRYALAWNEGRMLMGFMDMNRQYKNYYTYNEEGLRTKKVQTQYGVTTTTEYVWGKNGLAGFVKGDDKVVVLYGSDGLPIGFNLNGRVYTYVKNLQGDVLRILDTLGSTVVEYTYDPWGVPTITGDTDLAAINPCSYRCYDYDEESGYYYLQSRYYDPELGRFLNADDTSVLQISLESFELCNLFSYCGNHPVNDSDPAGYLSLNGIMDIIKNVFKSINSSINKYFTTLFVYDAYKKILSISTDVVSTAIDTIIAILIKQLVYKTVQVGLKMLLKNQTIRKAFVKQIFDFFVNNRLGRIVLSGIVSVGLNIAGVKGSVRTLADSMVSNLISNIVTNKWKILQAPISLITAFSSIGGITAFFFDLLDEKWDDYVSIKIS